MARLTKISDEALLDAARTLFTEKGPRATTAEIAARAGVSEGSLFKRFRTKAALHKAAMSSSMVGEWIQREMPAHGPLRTEKSLARFIRWQVDLMRDVVPVALMAWSSRLDTEELPGGLTGDKPAPVVAIQTVAGMLQREMDAGHLVSRNAEVIARIINGAVWHCVFLGLVLEKTGSARLDVDTFVEELARVVFGYLDPAREPGRKRGARR